MSAPRLIVCEFLNYRQVTDPEALINILKTSLRTSNLHLTNAALSALPAILPSLITRPTHAAQFASNASLVASSTTSSVSSGAFDVQFCAQLLAHFSQRVVSLTGLEIKKRLKLKHEKHLFYLADMPSELEVAGLCQPNWAKGKRLHYLFLNAFSRKQDLEVRFGK
jgi:hypothetical protein